MNEDETLQLVEDKKLKKVNLSRCIICQKDKRSENLTSTENGRSNIRTASDALKDDLLADLDDEDIDSICYHLKACYKPYILRSKKAESTQETDSIDENAAELDETKFKTPGCSKRRKTDETPMHVSISQTIHEVCRSKELIQIFNHMGLCRSYDEVEKIDSALAQCTISRAGLNHVPVPPSKVLIQDAMDNSDHEENTKPGTDESHDTILMLFQNRENNVENNVNGISVRHGATNEKKALNEMLHWQKLIRAGKLGNRGQIPENFLPGEPYKAGDTENSSNLDYATWIMTRYVTKSHLPEYSSCEKPSIPSFTATNSVLDHTQHPLTNIAFTPIIPYPATEYDTINTCMRNFQDVLSQNDLEYGPLWCDEGVY